MRTVSASGGRAAYSRERTYLTRYSWLKLESLIVVAGDEKWRCHPCKAPKWRRPLLAISIRIGPAQLVPRSKGRICSTNNLRCVRLKMCLRDSEEVLGR